MAAGHIFTDNGIQDYYAAGVEGAIVTTPLPVAILLLGPGLIGIAAMRKRFGM
jgi:hypothetical protein